MTRDGRSRTGIHTVNGSGAGLRTGFHASLAPAARRTRTLGPQMDGDGRR